MRDKIDSTVSKWMEENYDNYIDFFSFSYDSYWNNSIYFLFDEYPISIVL